MTSESLCDSISAQTGYPVVRGPLEATVVGNALVQARAHGEIAGDLSALRLTRIR
jgi:rhamnulokinase